MVRRPHSILIILLLVYAALAFFPESADAFWVWTPETNKWVNPKYAVKETPIEQLEYALGFIEQDNCKSAIKEFKKLLKHYPRSKEAPEAQFHIAQCYEKMGNLYAAFKGYQLVIDKYPFSDRSAEIVGRQYAIGVRILEGKEERNKFLNALAGADYNVIDIFRTVIKNAPYGEYAGPSQYKIALYLLEQKLYHEARDEFEKVVNDYPNTEWAKAAKYQIAITDSQRSSGAQYDQKITQAAVEEFKDFVKNYPDAELSADAKNQVVDLRDKEAENNFLVAQFYEKQKNYGSAKIYYQSIVDEYGDTKWAKKSLERIQEVTKRER